MPTGGGDAVFLIMQSYKKKLTCSAVAGSRAWVLGFFKKNTRIFRVSPVRYEQLYRLYSGFFSKLYIDYLGSMSTFH